MGDVTIPKVHGEAGVVAAYACDEVLPEGANDFLGMVGAVAMRRTSWKFSSALVMNFLIPEGHSFSRTCRVGLRPRKQRYLWRVV